MHNSESINSRDFCSRINDRMSPSNVRFSKKINNILKLHKILRKKGNTSGLSQQELAKITHKTVRIGSFLFSISNMWKNVSLSLINIVIIAAHSG
jgi:hypothetical protein